MTNFNWKSGIQLVFFLSFSSLSNASPTKPTVILVDKKSNTLQLAHYSESRYEIIKTYHTTVGKVRGDKIEEGDLKTPEGVYQFKSRLTPPSLKPKFGVMAFYMNYPNPFDQIAGRTGFDIMLHATDAPSRLEQDFDSKGCIVVKNEELKELDEKIQIGLTPILVFSDLSTEYRQPGLDKTLKSFFNSWISDWKTKNLDLYISHYHSQFTSKGKNKAQWKDYKGSLNQRYKKIEIVPENIQYFRHPKHSMIMFVQKYRSTLNSGHSGHWSKGTKTIYIAEENNDYKIISEDYTPRTW